MMEYRHIGMFLVLVFSQKSTLTCQNIHKILPSGGIGPERPKIENIEFFANAKMGPE